MWICLLCGVWACHQMRVTKTYILTFSTFPNLAKLPNTLIIGLPDVHFCLFFSNDLTNLRCSLQGGHALRVWDGALVTYHRFQKKNQKNSPLGITGPCTIKFQKIKLWKTNVLSIFSGSYFEGEKINALVVKANGHAPYELQKDFICALDQSLWTAVADWRMAHVHRAFCMLNAIQIVCQILTE